MKSLKTETMVPQVKNVRGNSSRPLWGWFCTLTAALLVLGNSASGQIFTENWEQETVGDQLHQLVNWDKITADNSNGSVVNPSTTDKFLQTVSTTNGFRLRTVGDWTRPTVLSIEIQTAITNTGGTAGELQLFVTARKPDTTWGDLAYGIYLRPGVVANQLQIRETAGNPLQNATFVAGTGLNTFRLDINTTNPAETVLTLFANGNQIGTSFVDNTPFALGSDFKIWLEAKNGLTADVYNVAAIPEPSTTALIGLLLFGLLAGRHRRRTNMRI